MSETIRLTIVDEGTRRALESVLWDHMATEVTGGDALDQEFASAGVATLRRLDFGTYEENVTAIDDKLATLATLRTAVERVRAAEVGDTFELPMSSQDLVSHLKHGAVPTIEEYEGFWERPDEERAEMIVSRDSAARLLAECVEAVA